MKRHTVTVEAAALHALRVAIEAEKPRIGEEDEMERARRQGTRAPEAGQR